MVTEPAEVVNYDPAWVELFQSLATRLQAALNGLETAIEHVGSTSVPGLAAKPIIDIDIVVDAEADVPMAIQRLEAAGYRWKGQRGGDRGKHPTDGL